MFGQYEVLLIVGRTAVMGVTAFIQPYGFPGVNVSRAGRWYVFGGIPCFLFPVSLTWPGENCLQ